MHSFNFFICHVSLITESWRDYEMLQGTDESGKYIFAYELSPIFSFCGLAVELKAQMYGGWRPTKTGKFSRFSTKVTAKA